MRKLMLIGLVVAILAAYSWASEEEFQAESRAAGLRTWSAMQLEAGR